jgi:hypothetical protein
VHDVLHSPGKPLDRDTRAFFEPRFGHDFGSVRVHADALAAESARAVNAQAYTVGHNLVFGSNQFAPQSQGGRKLLAHELTHAVQQSAGDTSSLASTRLRVVPESSPDERVADAVAEAVTSQRSHSIDLMGARPRATSLQRKVSPDLSMMEHVLRSRGFLEGKTSPAEVHNVLLKFKALSDQDLQDTVRALETADKSYIERFLTNISEDDKLNELETLRRVKNVRVWKVETKTGETTTTTEAVGSCSPGQFETIRQAANTGLAWLNKSIDLIDAFVAAPSAPGNADVASALDAHFHNKTVPVVHHIRERLRQIRNDIQGAQQFSIECHGDWDRDCSNAGAYALPDRIVFCLGYFRGGPDWQAPALVHEMAHSQVGGVHVTDRAYQTNRLLRFLSTEEALTNAESYGMLVWQLGKGEVIKSTAPQDKPEDCPPAWWDMLQRGVAVAERWNRNLQVTLSTLKPAALQPPSKWGTYLGGNSQSDIDKAKKSIDRVASKLESQITFECEPGGGGRCDGGTHTYWYFRGNLHICPAWQAQKTEDDRVKSLLAGLYGYIGDVDPDSRRINYAQLAQENNAPWAGAPKLEKILGGGKWTPDLINISLIPEEPKAPKYMYTESGTDHQRMSQDQPVYQVQTPPPLSGSNNFRVNVDFGVDYSGEGRPLPFSPPHVSVTFDYLLMGKPFTRTQTDDRPVYNGEGSPLETKIEKGLGAFFDRDGPLHMRFELKDPDSKVDRVYDDTIQIQLVPAGSGPAAAPKP